jgi:hypothetical protein
MLTEGELGLTDVDLSLLHGDHVTVDLDTRLVNLDNVIRVREQFVAGKDWSGRERRTRPKMG